MALMMSVSGVRGLIGETMTPELAASMGAAFGTFLDGGAVVLGMDSRPSGEMVKGAVESGLLAVGCNVVELGIATTPGVALMVSELNAKGGIAGKYPVELEIRDSQYNANTAQQNYSDLRNKVVMIEQILGTDVTNAVLKQMQADNMVASPATLDAEWVRDPNLLPIAAPYQIEAINGL